MGNDQSGCCKYVCCGRQLNSISFESFLEEADTGDIVLFNQKSVVSSWKCFSRSEWNHVAIVVNTPRGIKFLVEAVEPHVLAVKLEIAMETWLLPGQCRRVAWRQLSGITRDRALVRACFDFTMQLQNRPFEENWMELVKAIFKQDAERCCGQRRKVKKKHLNSHSAVTQSARQRQSEDLRASNAEDPASPTALSSDASKPKLDMLAGIEPGTELHDTTQSLFCSELTAFYYQQAGWMSKEQLPCRFLPKDFADYRNANVPYYLNDGISLGEMLVIEPPAITKLPEGDEVPRMGNVQVEIPQENPVHRNAPATNKRDSVVTTSGTEIQRPSAKTDVPPDQNENVVLEF